jgi:transcriptional regulator with XRE-family HTH domain
MIDPEDTGDFQMDVARRLLRTRQVLNLDQAGFGGPAGISQSRLSNYETGGRPLTLRAALSLCDAHNLTLDWLFRGDPSGLPYRLHDALKAFRARISKKA